MSNWYAETAGSWISFEEARERSLGAVEWWRCEGVNGERTPELQQRPDGPVDRPVWHNGSGKMYLGGWIKHPTKDSYQWHGFGVYCRKDGRVFVGNWDEGKLNGMAKRVWLPSAPHWVRNSRESSIIVSRPRDEGEEPVGLPFIYIGKFRGNWKDDEKATVILKDGTTRIGPWEKNDPVGDWWEDHEKSFTGPKGLAEILSFAMYITDDADSSMLKSIQEEEASPEKYLAGLKLSKTTSTEYSDDGEDSDSDDEGNVTNLLDVSKLSVNTNDFSVHSKATTIRSNLQRKEKASTPPKPQLPTTYDEEHLTVITKWLTEEVIQHYASHDEMEAYARNFLDVGLHSIEVIQEMTTPADVAAFTWMKDFHRRRFLAWVNKAAKRNKEHWSRLISAIAEWLGSEAIGYDADMMEMSMYAQNFVHLGFHSVPMILEVCTQEDVTKFSWMKPIHKRLLCRALPERKMPRRTTSV